MTTDLKILNSLVFTHETTLIDIPTFERKERELKRYIARLNSVQHNISTTSVQHNITTISGQRYTASTAYLPIQQPDIHNDIHNLHNLHNLGGLIDFMDMTVNNNILTMYMEFAQGALEDVPVTLDTKKINQFPRKKYSECDNLEDDTCAVCQVKYADDDQLTILPCNGHHRYHTACIEEWLTKFSKKCPSCRQNLDDEVDE